MATLIENPVLPAGEYWIGDLCYVMHKEWEEICAAICVNNITFEPIVMKLADGRIIALNFTKHGDGIFFDKQLNQYPVDSGSIGAILVSDIKEKENMKLGNIHQLNEFEPDNDDGVLIFDNIRIDTDESNYDEYYEGEEDDYA